jgi:hypothetical protein
VGYQPPAKGAEERGRQGEETGRGDRKEVDTLRRERVGEENRERQREEVDTD